MKMIAGALVALALTAPAMAADKGGPPPEKQATLVDNPIWNRSTFYIGALAGYDASVFEADNIKLGDAKLFGGAFGGFNYRVSKDLIAGVEVDYMLTDVKGQIGNGIASVTASTDYLATVRGRVGMPFGPALAYLTAGVAFTDQKANVLGASEKDTLVGLAVGGGIELELSQGMFARLEGMHYTFDASKVDMGGGNVVEVSNDHTTVRVGLGFKLN